MAARLASGVPSCHSNAPSGIRGVLLLLSLLRCTCSRLKWREREREREGDGQKGSARTGAGSCLPGGRWWCKAAAKAGANLGCRRRINCAVIARDGTNLNEEGVINFCKKNMAAFKVPKKVFMTDSLPKTASGKIQRRIVSEHFLAQISTAKVPKFGA